VNGASSAVSAVPASAARAHSTLQSASVQLHPQSYSLCLQLCLHQQCLQYLHLRHGAVGLISHDLITFDSMVLFLRSAHRLPAGLPHSHRPSSLKLGGEGANLIRSWLLTQTTDGTVAGHCS